MIEDENIIGTSARAGELLLYDYFKHLTTLCLLTLGGVLTLAGTVDREDVKPVMLVLDLCLIGLAGVCSFGGASEIVRAQITETPPRPYMNRYRVASPIFLSDGVGLFLGMYVDSLN